MSGGQGSRDIGRGLILSLLMVLSGLAIFPIHVSEAAVCNVPSGVPDLSTAIALGCTNIVFDGNVVDNNNVVQTGAAIGFSQIVIEGNGYTLSVSAPQPYINLIDVPSLNISNLNITVTSPNNDFLLLDNTSLSIENTSILFQTTGTMINMFGNSRANLTVISSNFTNTLGLGTLFASNLFDLVKNVELENVSISGFQSSILMYISGDIWINRLYSDSITDFTIFSPGISRIMVNNSLYDLDSPLLEVGLGLRMVTGSFNTFIRNVTVVGQISLGIAIRIVTTGEVNVSIEDVSIQQASLNQGIGIDISRFRSTVIAEDINVEISDVTVKDTDYGVTTWSVITWPVPLGPHESVYVNISDFTIEASTVGILTTSSPNGDLYLYVEDGYIDADGYAIIPVSANYAATYVYNVNTSSNLGGIWVVTWSFPEAESYLYTEWWFDDRASPSYSLQISEFPFFDGVVSTRFNVSFSLIETFDVVAGDGILFETVYTPFGSVGQPDSIWTLNIQVLSSITGLPVSGIAIDFWESGSYLTTSYTGGDGNSYTTFSYEVDPSNPFIQNLVFSISTTYFSGSWSYLGDFGYTYTLPSWYGKIILRIPLLAIRAYGYSDHIPALLSIYGDRGSILLFPDASSLVKYMFGEESPFILLNLKVLDAQFMGLYSVVDAVVYGPRIQPTPVRLYIYPEMGVIRANGPIDMIFYIR